MKPQQKVIGPINTNIVKSTKFVLMTSAALPAKGLQNAVIGEIVNETGIEKRVEINRIRVPVSLEEKNSGGQNHVLDKVYNIGENGRRLGYLLNDYYDWSGIKVDAEDMYGFDLADALNGKSVVVDVGYHVIGSRPTPYIKSFHPAGYWVFESGNLV